MPLAVAAQDAAQPAAKAPADSTASKWDIFAGYSYLAPKGTVSSLQPGGKTYEDVSYDAVNVGGLFSGAYFFNRYVGAQAEFGLHQYGVQNGNASSGTKGDNDGFTTISGGLIFRYPTSDLTPFVHALVGAAQVEGPQHQRATWGPVLTVGGGVDYETPFFKHRLAIRVFQVDYEYMHADFGTGVWEGRANINAARLSAGVVLHSSLTPAPPVTLACSASPASVFAGDPVTVTATAGNLNPKLSTVYSWFGTGVTGNGATATVATASLAPGSYTVKGTVKEGKAGKEGLKAGESADCSASFTVKAFEPPTVSCSASPSTIKPGETSTITASGVSPQNRPLTYSYATASGTVNGSGTTATYSSTGAPTGAVGVTCNVTDDKGQVASGTTTVTILAPPAPSAPHTEALCSITFSKDKKRPTRVDNEAKACLDEVALDLQKQSDAKAVVVGEADAKENAKVAKAEKAEAKKKHAKAVVSPAEERAVNTKEYLVKEKGIDASRISVATGTTDGQKVEDYLVPAGASFSADVTGTTPVSETKVKPQARKPLGENHHAKKSAKASAKK
jgi:hypothetical protein